MKRKKWPLILFFIILAAGLAGSFLALRPSHSREVEILRDGEVLYRLDLSKEKDRTIQIEYEGRTNTVEIRITGSAWQRRSARTTPVWRWDG